MTLKARCSMLDEFVNLLLLGPVPLELGGHELPIYSLAAIEMVLFMKSNLRCITIPPPWTISSASSE